MRSITKKNTRPELAVRRLLHAMGLRFRLHRSDLPGTPDIVLPRHGTAVQVHGCFWHQHPGCPYARQPRSRLDYVDRHVSLDPFPAMPAATGNGLGVLVLEFQPDVCTSWQVQR